jgi:hypothetical protein
MVRPAGAERFIRAEPEGLRVTLPKDRDDLEPVKLSTRFGVQGDFEITATVAVLQAGKMPSGAWGVGAALFLSKVDPTNQGVSLGRLSRSGGKEVIYWDRYGIDGEADIDFQPCPEKVVRLRMKRTASQVSYFLGKGLDGEQFELLGSKELGRDDMHQVTLRVLTGRKPFSVDARLIDLRIRSGGAPGAPITAEPFQGGAGWRAWWCAAAGLFAASFLCVMLAWRLRARARKKEGAGRASSFACSGCGRRLNLNPDLTAKKVKCKECGAIVQVPV